MVRYDVLNNDITLRKDSNDAQRLRRRHPSPWTTPLPVRPLNILNFTLSDDA